MDLSSNLLTTIPAGVMIAGSGYDTIYGTLDLSSNRITLIEANAFVGLIITSLFIKNNLLTELIPGVFNDMPLLASLGLNINQITSIPRGVFVSSLISLNFISLQRNQLTSFSPAILSNLHNINSIDLSSNLITNVNANEFSGFAYDVNSIVLSLSQQTLDTISSNAFNGTPIVTSLSLFRTTVRIIHSDAFPVTLTTFTCGDVSTGAQTCSANACLLQCGEGSRCYTNTYLYTHTRFTCCRSNQEPCESTLPWWHWWSILLIIGACLLVIGGVAYFVYWMMYKRTTRRVANLTSLNQQAVFIQRQKTVSPPGPVSAPAPRGWEYDDAIRQGKIQFH